MIPAFRIVLLVLAVLAVGPIPRANSQGSYSTTAGQAILVDTSTGMILFEHNADQAMAPSSMSKLMTLYILFDELANGGLTLEDTFAVSERAWRMQGSKMWVEVDTFVSIEDLIRGIVVQSGNDACIVVAEGISGTEESFADLMNDYGLEIGLTGSNFVNSSGWPDPDHFMTARDLAVLSQRLIEDFPEFYHYFAETEFTWSNITQPNRNRLLGRRIGVDGLKTGSTDSGGYGLASSAIRDGRRLVAVVNGLDGQTARERESERLLTWGFREFDSYSLFEAGETVDTASVWLGEEDTVDLVVETDVTYTLPRRARRGMEVSVSYDNPLPAPILAGQDIGTLTVALPDREDIVLPLKAGQSVGQLNFAGRISAAFNYLLWGSGSGN